MLPAEEEPLEAWEHLQEASRPFPPICLLPTQAGAWGGYITALPGVRQCKDLGMSLCVLCPRCSGLWGLHERWAEPPHTPILRGHGSLETEPSFPAFAELLVGPGNVPSDTMALPWGQFRTAAHPRSPQGSSAPHLQSHGGREGKHCPLNVHTACGPRRHRALP